MFSATETGSNLYQCVYHRELGLRQQNNPKAFTANLFRERYRVARNLYKSDLLAHYGCVNAIEFSHGGRYLASGGDDKRVLIWDVEMAIAGVGQPRILETEHTSNIFCLGFDRQNSKVFSGGNDDLVIMHDFETGKLANVFKHDNPVYGLSIDPQCDSIFATACEDGQILVFDQRVDPADPFVVAQLRTSFHAVEFHPAGGNFLVTANSKRGAAFWDIRKPHNPVIQYGYMEDPPSCMSVRFNTTGNLILALRRRLPPILYNTLSPEPVCTFYHGNYYNSCTMKSCSFAGIDDEFVLSGSDDFNLYVWRVSDVDLDSTDQWIESTQMVLYGHRSIVNQVRYNRQKCLLASSGVEKIIKLWSPFPQKGWTGSLLEEAIGSDNPRELYSPYNFATMATPPHSWSHMSHDYSSRNISESPRMMAFFDSLIQQEIEGWETNSSTESPIDSDDSSSHISSSSNMSSDSNLSLDDDDDDDGDNGRGARGRRPKRYLVRKRECKRVLRKVQVQRQKYANRIAYLIATKRSTLRRLAIKSASIRNSRPYKVVKVQRKSANQKKCGGGVTKSKRALQKRRIAQKVVPARSGNVAAAASTSSTAVASTSAAAASTSARNTRVQRKKCFKNYSNDTSSDDDTGSEAPVSSCSSRSGLTFPSNIPVPSTSTGITSSLKDDIIRLRQQQQHIIDSDEDDDDDDDEDGLQLQNSTETVAAAIVQPTTKLNGLRRANDSTENSNSNAANPITTTTRSPADSVGNSTTATSITIPSYSNNHSQQRPQLRLLASTALNTTSPTQPSTSIAAMITTTLPQTRSRNANNNNLNSSLNQRTSSHIDFIDTYSSHSNSRLSNSSYQDDILDSSPSASASSSNEMISLVSNNTTNTNTNTNNSHNSSSTRQSNHHNSHSTPLKRRRLAISDYISNVTGELSDADAIEENNNEQNNNNIFPMHFNNATEHRTTTNNNHNINNLNSNTTRQICDKEEFDNSTLKYNRRQHSVSNNANTITNNNNNANTNSNNNSQNRDMLLQCQQNSDNDNYASTSKVYTSDSGINLGTTPDRNQYPRKGCISLHYNDSDSDGALPPLMATNNRPMSPTNCTENGKGGGGRKTVMNLYQQKVSRIRRNYRRKVAEESDSD